MVSAWAYTNGIVLGQRKTQDRSNETTAISELLKVLGLQVVSSLLTEWELKKKYPKRPRIKKLITYWHL
jgi:hypothetical protein